MSERVTCPATVNYKPEDRQHYDDIPDGANVVNQPEHCRLDPEHDGAHSGLVQSQDRDCVVEALWWVAWSDDGDAYVIEQDDGCPALNDVDEVCLLRQGHPGGHDFS